MRTQKLLRRRKRVADVLEDAAGRGELAFVESRDSPGAAPVRLQDEEHVKKEHILIRYF